MALDVGRWLKYAQAKLNGAVRSGNEELDRLEAEREVELADKPWLASDSAAPTFDEARARIEREAADATNAAAPTPSAPAPSAPTPPSGPTVPSSGTDAEVAAAKVELEQRDEEAKARLDAIRDELGVDPPAPGSP